MRPHRPLPWRFAAGERNPARHARQGCGHPRGRSSKIRRERTVRGSGQTRPLQDPRDRCGNDAVGAIAGSNDVVPPGDEDRACQEESQERGKSRESATAK